MENHPPEVVGGLNGKVGKDIVSLKASFENNLRSLSTKIIYH